MINVPIFYWATRKTLFLGKIFDARLRGSDCHSHSYCVSAPITTSTPTPTPTGPVTLPGPTQAGIPSNCNKYVLQQEGEFLLSLEASKQSNPF